jgi:A/G-specific adenine glycosylase
MTEAGPGVDPRARDAILAWFEAHGRDLPFRKASDPYGILVSEAMAQQTQAARAGDAWLRFMAAFPTVASLAAATPAHVLRAWRGLGYNRRALHLWRAAREIVDRHGGQVPADIAALEALPGVGPYTARAVAAIAFGIPAGAVDTNVRRVLGRVAFGGSDVAPRGIQALADTVVPADRAAAWTHAVMDLGASICRPRVPLCDDCPVRKWCRLAAAAGGDAADRSPDRLARRQPAPRFPMTTRWLRGRIVDRLRVAADGSWTVIEPPIGAHGPDAVHAALLALARDKIVEVRQPASPEGVWHARLPVG